MTSTVSAWPVLPVQTSSYVGAAFVPPIYPTEVSRTPGIFQNLRSAPQKHPVAKYAREVLGVEFIL